MSAFPKGFVVVALVFSVCIVGTFADADHSGDWTYDFPDRDWPGVAPECAGQRQSPIDIVDEATIPTTAFLRQYQSRIASFDIAVKNNGHSVEMDLSQRGLYLTSSLFTDLLQAVQVHWHAPAEHRLGGRQYVAEMHVVYSPVDRAFCGDGRPPQVVVGYLLDSLDESDLATLTATQKQEWQKRHNDSLLNEILSHKEALDTVNNVVNVSVIPRMPFMEDFYVYDGSLTTPPCKETVMWWLSPTPIRVPASQVGELVSLLRKEFGGTGDARAPQPLNGRSVRRVKAYAAQPVKF